MNSLFGEDKKVVLLDGTEGPLRDLLCQAAKDFNPDGISAWEITPVHYEPHKQGPKPRNRAEKAQHDWWIREGKKKTEG